MDHICTTFNTLIHASMAETHLHSARQPITHIHTVWATWKFIHRAHFKIKTTVFATLEQKPSYVSSNSQKAVYYLRNNARSYKSTTWLDKYDCKTTNWEKHSSTQHYVGEVAEVLEAMSQKRLLKFATTMIRLWVKPAGDSSLCVANGQKNQQRADTSSWIKKEPVFPIMKTGVNACSFLERKKQKYPSARGKTANCGNIYQVNVCWCQQICC